MEMKHFEVGTIKLEIHASKRQPAKRPHGLQRRR